MRKIFCLSFLAVPLMLLSGCNGNNYTYPEPSPEKADGACVSTTGTVKVGSAEYVADFGTITVSENRNKRTSRLIHLPYIRVHSSSKNPQEPIVVLNGGPGGSNMRWDWGIMWYLLPEHDIIAVGYRGVDGLTALDCPEVAQAIKGNGDLLGEESLQSIGRAWTASAKRLASEGIDLDGYTMIECIEDIEAVRNALGYERINLISGSYGTRVAYLYGLKHPEHIRRSAMICVNPPGGFTWEPETIDRQLRRYSDLWSQDSVMSVKSKDLYADMQHVLKNLPRKWLVFSIDPGKVKVVTFALLYHRNTAAMVFDAYEAAREGDPSGLALMSIAYDYVVPSMGTWGDMASKAVSADFDSTRNYNLEMEPLDYPLGSPMSKLQWGPLRYGSWPIQQIPEEFRRLQHSDVETLLLSGSMDFANPPELARDKLLPYLNHGTQVILSECGHFNDVMYLHPENTRRLLTSFYRTGVADTSLNTYKPMNFHVSWGFPTLAKVAVGTFTVIGTAAVVGIVLLIKKAW